MSELDERISFDEQIEKLNSLLQREDGRKYIKENFVKIKRLLLHKLIQKNLNGFFEFIQKLKEFPEFQEEYDEYVYWGELYDQIQIPEYNIKSIGNSINDIFKMRKEEIKKLRTSREGKIMKELVFRNILLSEDPVSRQEKRIILQEISRGEKYKFRSFGSSGIIIQTGDQVVKLALASRKFEIPYHPRIMMPYFRKKYKDDSCLEIFNYGNAESADITDEKLLEIYKELDAAGIIWGDASKRNLLVLLKDNDLPDYIASKEFNVFGFLEDSRFPTNNHVSLKTGDIVVCDLDMLYAKDDPEVVYGNLDDIIENYIMLQSMCISDEIRLDDDNENTLGGDYGK